MHLTTEMPPELGELLSHISNIYLLNVDYMMNELRYFNYWFKNVRSRSFFLKEHWISMYLNAIFLVTCIYVLLEVLANQSSSNSN